MEERLYDLIFIIRPATPEDEIKKVEHTVEHACADRGGKIEKTEHWGTRKLAYKVAKHREGIYVYQQVRTNHGELVHELERRSADQCPAPWALERIDPRLVARDGHRAGRDPQPGFIPPGNAGECFR